MRAIDDLPNDVLNNIASLLDQCDLIILGRTCRALNAICNQWLYANIYITERKFSLKKPINNRGDEADLCKWSIINYAGQSKSKLRLFERSLATNPKLVHLIKRVISDSIKFALFKLKFWCVKHFQKGNVKEIYFGNIPMAHFELIFDELWLAYTTPQILSKLRVLQLRNCQDLNHVVKAVDIETTGITTIYFILNDVKSLDPSIDDITSTRQLLGKLSQLHVCSAHDLGLNFLRGLYESLGEGVFNVDELHFSHLHGQPSARTRFDFSQQYEASREMPLDFDVLVRLFNLPVLRTLDLRIGCNNSRFPPLSHSVPFEALPNSGCTCVAQFFQRFRGSVEATMPQLSHLSISREGHAIVVDPCSFYMFKNLLIHLFLAPFARLTSVVVDTSADLYPYLYFSHVHSPAFNSMTSAFISQNDLLARLIRGITTISLPDYFQSAYIWTRAHKDSHMCKCDNCTAAEATIAQLVAANTSIHSHLDPTAIKSMQEVYSDVLTTVLSQCAHLPHRLGLPCYSIMALLARSSRSVHHLHPPSQVPCKCTGNEFGVVSQYLNHQLTASLANIFTPSQLTVNGFTIVAVTESK